MNDLNCLSYWFPKLEAAGLPVPRTEVVRAPDLIGLFDQQTPEGWGDFLARLREACGRVGYPCFLRTGQTSAKHGWLETCHVPGPEALPGRVFKIVEFSEMADFFGLPHDVWAAREMLPTVPQMVAYKGMPVCREFRCFVRDGELLCHHPYWPYGSLLEGAGSRPCAGLDQAYAALCYLPANDRDAVFSLARRSGAALGGEWSVDVLETKRGWYVTDCAVAARSFHWEGCPNHPKALAGRV